MSDHFESKSPLNHVLEKRAEGALAFGEGHGSEIPLSLSIFLDTLKESALLLLLLTPFLPSALLLTAIGIGWAIWKAGRSAHWGWSRLERLHRITEQEKFEIETHRDQEREELTALYEAKGFTGELLTQVVETLMADKDRLLKVMLEEELGLTLGIYEHPLKHALFALLGSLLPLVISLLSLFFFSTPGILLACGVLIAGGAGWKAKAEGNRVVAAVIWTGAVTALAWGCTLLIPRL